MDQIVDGPASALHLAQQGHGKYGATSLAQLLFNPGLRASTVGISAPTGYIMECRDCGTPIFEIIGGCLRIHDRHHGNRHTNVIPIDYLVQLADRTTTGT